MLVIFWQKVKKVLDNKSLFEGRIYFWKPFGKKSSKLYVLETRSNLYVNQIVSYYQVFFRLFRPIICLFLRAVCCKNVRDKKAIFEGKTDFW